MANRRLTIGHLVFGGDYGSGHDDGVDRRANWVFPERGKDNRTKSEWPYSYSDFYLWGHGQYTPGVQGVYHDRLQEWHGKKYFDAYKKHLGNRDFRSMTPEQASNFLSDLLDKPVKVVGVSEGCNPSNGYPYWALYYSEEKR